MKDLIKNFIDRFFFTQETVYFALLIFITAVCLILFGNILLPILISLVIAFLLNGLVVSLESFRLSRWLSLALSLIIFFGLYASMILILPSIVSQINSLLQTLPNIFTTFQENLSSLTQSYPDIFSEEEVRSLLANLSSQINTLLSGALGQIASTISFAFNALLYAILIPIMVFFFVKDKKILLPLLTSFLPKERKLMDSIFNEMNEQLFNYVTGKLIEMLIVGGVSYLVFSYLALPYSILLSILVGLSVIIPFFGAILVTIPVLLVGIYEWGLSTEFYWLLALYLTIQALDGNLLVPLLFSVRNKLHPVLIIVAVLFFGGLWGFWGMFFAIPLATFIKAIINSWPRNELT
tara:strand:- start:11026 stop:12078 length:1053 start_codon:yes stop_codon:yes gene_type:complete